MQKRMFGNILHFEKPVDFCRLSKVILDVFITYLIGSTVFADFQFCIGLPRLFKLCVSYFILGIAYRMVYFDSFLLIKSSMIYI